MANPHEKPSPPRDGGTATSEPSGPQDKQRPLQPGEKTPAGTLAAASSQKPPGEPDVLLDVPELKLEELDLDVDRLEARVALHAALGQLLALDVGADVSIGRVHLVLKGVSARATLKVRLEQVYAILDRALTTVETHPDILKSVTQPLGQALEDVGTAAQSALGPGGAIQEATHQLGDTAARAVAPGGAVPALAEGVGGAAEAAGKALPGAVESAGGAARQVGAAVPGGIPPAAGPAGSRGPPAGAASLAGTAGSSGQRSAPTSRAASSPLTPSAPRAPGSPHPLREAAPRGLDRGLSLFDGSQRSLESWRHLGGGSLQHDAQGFVRLQASSTLGLLYHSAGRFPQDLRLRLLLRPDSPDTVFGVALRFCDPRMPVPDRQDPSRRYEYPNPAQVAVDTGFEVQLGRLPMVEPGTVRGVMLADVVGAQRHAARATLRDDEWNALEIEVHDDDYLVRLNGKETSRFHNVDTFRGKPEGAGSPSGFVGILMRRGRLLVREVVAEGTLLPAVTPEPSQENRDFGSQVESHP